MDEVDCFFDMDFGFIFEKIFKFFFCECCIFLFFVIMFSKVEFF